MLLRPVQQAAEVHRPGEGAAVVLAFEDLLDIRQRVRGRALAEGNRLDLQPGTGPEHLDDRNFGGAALVGGVMEEEIAGMAGDGEVGAERSCPLR